MITERHNIACRMIFKAIRKTGSLESCIVSKDIGSDKRMTMQNLQISETAESRIVPKWLFPSRFPDKDRFTSSRPDFVLVTPIAAKTQKQQTSLGGWVLRSGRGQLRETGSTSAAPPATSRSTNPRQHRPKDLSKPRRDIHTHTHTYTHTHTPTPTHTHTHTHTHKHKHTAKEQHKDLCNIPRSLRYSPHHPLGCGWHHLQHSHSEAFQGTGSRFSKS